MATTKGQCWSAEEDSKIIRLVGEHGIKKWSVVAAELPGRNGKQCRERWHNQLDPNIRRGPWTYDEDQILLRAHAEFGSKWSVIAKQLPGRTDNSIKNRWNSALRRELRKMNRAAEDAEMGRTPDPDIISPAEPSNPASGPVLLGPPSDGPHQASPGSDAPHPLADQRTALRSELTALGDSSTDDVTKAALRAQLIEQLRQLNATWEETGATPSANHIQELGKQVSRLQDFCRDLVGSSLTRQQRELASGIIPKRRQCMARGRRRAKKTPEGRRRSLGATDEVDATEEGRSAKRRKSGVEGPGPGDLSEGLTSRGLSASGGEGSEESGEEDEGEEEEPESDVTGTNPMPVPLIAVQETSASADVAAAAAEIPTLVGDADMHMRIGPVFTPNGTNLLNFDVDELLQITSSTIQDVLQSPRGAPLVTLSPAGGNLVFNLPTPCEPTSTPPRPSARGPLSASFSLSALPSPDTAAASIAAFTAAARGQPAAQAGSSTADGHSPGSAAAHNAASAMYSAPQAGIASGGTPRVDANAHNALKLAPAMPSPLPRPLSAKGGPAGAHKVPLPTLGPSPSGARTSAPPPLPPRVSPTAAQKPSTLSQRRRPSGATNLHIASVAGERPIARTAPPKGAESLGGSPQHEGGNAAPTASAAALPTPLQNDPLAKAVVNDVNSWLEARSA